MRLKSLVLLQVCCPLLASGLACRAWAEPVSPLAGCDAEVDEARGVAFRCGPLLVTAHQAKRLTPAEIDAKLDTFSSQGKDDPLPSERKRFDFKVDGRVLPAIRVSGPTRMGGHFAALLIVDNRDAGSSLHSCGGSRAAMAQCEDLIRFLVRRGIVLTPAQELASRTRRTTQRIVAIKQAISNWAKDNGTGCPVSLKQLVEQRYLTREVTDAWGRAFLWRCPADHYPFTAELISFGADGREGTDDDIQSWHVEQ